MYKHLKIQFGASAELTLDFEILHNPVTDLWIECMLQRHKWPMDDPSRFYGFNTPAEEQERALQDIQQCISDINSYQPIIDRTIHSAHDQDTLNYLHHIFEVYHGLLDQQHTEWWHQAPESARKALAQLNIAVHRCESCRYSKPRFVCTWFGMPKTRTLSPDLMTQYAQEKIEFGGVYLNYVEIGKTALDLATDNDQYIFDEAFKPFNHYSADFVAYFFSNTEQQILDTRNLLKNYYQTNQEFFSKHGIQSADDYRIRPLRFKVAQLSYNNQQQVIDQLRKHQLISNIQLL